MAIDPSRFRQALCRFATGVTVVTTRDAAGTPFGLTVNAFCSVSLDPPMVLVSIDNRSDAGAGFRGPGLFAVSILAEHQEEWSRRFATPGPAKFQGVELLTGTTGVPLVPDALAHIECRVVHAYPGGDHTLYVGEVLELSLCDGDAAPLVYHDRNYRRLHPGER